MKFRSLLTLILTATVFGVCGTSHAISPFKKAFEDKYVKDSGSEDLQAAFRTSGCNVCHVKDEKKDVVNAYGLVLAELIEGNANDRVKEARAGGSDARKAEEEKLLKEFEEAMKKAESSKSPSGETYGDLFKAHRLPGAEGAKSIR